MKQLFIFSANEWCSACQSFKPVIQQTNVPVDQLRCFDVDESPNLARDYNVRGVPTSILIVDGKEVNRKTGMMTSKQLIEFCESQEK
jgi:thioredoxin-like negative regulator of GroEL